MAVSDSTTKQSLASKGTSRIMPSCVNSVFCFSVCWLGKSAFPQKAKVQRSRRVAPREDLNGPAASAKNDSSLGQAFKMFGFAAGLGSSVFPPNFVTK